MSERINIVLVCEQCASRNYKTTRSRGAVKPLEMSKYCPKCKHHTVHRESK